jgi:hypothetical protein
MQRVGLALGAPLGRLLGYRPTYEPRVDLPPRSDLMRRRWKRRLLWAALILGLLLLAIPATVGQGIAAVRRPKSSRERGPLERTPFAAVR